MESNLCLWTVNYLTQDICDLPFEFPDRCSQEFHYATSFNVPSEFTVVFMKQRAEIQLCLQLSNFETCFYRRVTLA